MESAEYRVLILKSPSEEDIEDPYVFALTLQKIPAVLVPMLEFQFKNLDRLRACLNAPELYSGLVFVSPRCVQSVVECYKKENIEKKNEWKNRLCFVVGEATARSVSRDLDLSYSGSTSGNMKALLQTIDPSKSDLTEQNLREGSLDKPLLLPCGSLNKPLPEEKHYNIEKVVVYETREHSQLKNRLEQLLKEKLDTFIVFFSPSGVEYAAPYIENISYSQIRFIALGPTTCEAMEKRNIKVSAVCEKPNPECLTREILNLIRR